ncbi:hypothetical protein BC826DRAFT_153018 [Russula brevipes]|nr:hypothetical protein BC826DRAFT_153018 [Russula brevipes]
MVSDSDTRRAKRQNELQQRATFKIPSLDVQRQRERGPPLSRTQRRGHGEAARPPPHPPPTTAPLPDDFDAITETRDSTTIYDDPPDSALDIDYDDMTVAPAPAPVPVPAPAPTPALSYSRSPIPLHAPVPVPLPGPLPTSPPRSTSNNLTSPPRQRRAGSPSHSIAGLSFSPDVRSPRRSDGMSTGKARSVAGGDRDRDRTSQRRSLGAGNPPPHLPFPPGRGPAKGRNELVEKLVLEDGPDRTVSVWREQIAKNGNEAAPGGSGAGADGNDGRSDLDSHVGRRRVSADSRRRVESLSQGPAGSPSVKSKGHRSRESADFTEVLRSPLQPTVPTRSSTPQVNTASQPTTPQKTQQRRAPTSPSVGPRGTEYSSSASDTTSQTRVASVNQLGSVLSSCQPSLLHLLPILEELGLRRSEHMTALARMREETRDREVKEEALRRASLWSSGLSSLTNCRACRFAGYILRNISRASCFMYVNRIYTCSVVRLFLGIEAPNLDACMWLEQNVCSDVIAGKGEMNQISMPKESTQRIHPPF